MRLALYNTWNRRLQTFRPRASGAASIYVCGPTLYDRLHLGHARSFVFFDVMARLLAREGVKVQFAMNMTDIDETIFDKARREGVSFGVLADRYQKIVLGELAALGIDTPTAYPRASKHISETVALAKRLVEEGWAYVADGHVFLEVGKLKQYGSLSGLSAAELSLKRMDLHPAKHDPLDILLWRECREEPCWQSPFGVGRPGWHIQDTAMALTVFGRPYDVHGGAVELIHPHHEALEAQGEAATGVIPFVNYWIHTGLVTVDGRKMSKSLGNVVYASEFLQKWGLEAARLYPLHMPRLAFVDFREDHADEAKDLGEKLAAAVKAVRGASSRPSLELGEAYHKFWSALRADLDFPRALAALARAAELAVREKRGANLLSSMLSVLGLTALAERAAS